MQNRVAVAGIIMQNEKWRTTLRDAPHGTLDDFISVFMRDKVVWDAKSALKLTLSPPNVMELLIEKI